MAKRDYYEVLGVNKNATDDELKSAFRKAAKKCHPDLNPDDKEAEARFKELNEAYEVLSDKQKRAQYDQFGHAAFDPASAAGGNYGAGGFGDFSDIFSSFFGGGFGREGSTHRRNGPMQGSDIGANLTLTFEEARLEREKRYSLTARKTAPPVQVQGLNPAHIPKPVQHAADRGRSGCSKTPCSARLQPLGHATPVMVRARLSRNPARHAAGAAESTREAA